MRPTSKLKNLKIHVFTIMKNSFTYSTASYCVYPLYLGIRSFLALFSPRGYISRPNHHQTLMDLILLVGFITFWSYLFSYDSTERGNHNRNQKIYIVPWFIVQKSSKAKRRIVPLRPCNFPLKSHTTSVVYSNHTNIIYLICIYVQKWNLICIYWSMYNIYCNYILYI